MSSRSFALTILTLALIALVLRVIRLDERPPHTDEAVNAWILGQLLAGEPFAFDPRDRHGPLLPAAGLAATGLLDRHTFAELDERAIRLAPAVIGAAATGLFALGTGVIPHGALASAAALWAVSPLPLYYSRYAIHETLLVAATLALLLLVARASAASTLRIRLAWAAAAGLAAGAMLAAKLSAALPLAAVAAAVIAWRLSPGDTGSCARFATSPSPGDAGSCPRFDTSPTPGDAGRRSTPPRAGARGSRNLLPAAAFVVVALFIVALAYTWGFTRAAGLRDLIFGLDAPLARAAGEGHEKGPLYFVGLLGHGAAGVLFLIAAVAGACLAWRRGGRIGRALVTYAAVLIAAHSAIPYKTPWLALGLFLPLALLAGWAISGLLAAAWRQAHAVRLATVVALGGCAAVAASASQRLVFADSAGETNPFAYAHTSADLRRLVPLVDALPGPEPLIAVQLEDAWPLPFLLRHQSHVGYWQPGQRLPVSAALVITTPELAATLPAAMAAWRPHYFSQRPGVMLVALENPAPAVSTP